MTDKRSAGDADMEPDTTSDGAAPPDAAASSADDGDGAALRETFADAFDREADPLVKYEAQFKALDEDPFDLFTEEVLATRDISDRTKTGYRRVFRDWRDHMAAEGRHPACPHERHVKAFARRELDEKENHPDTVKEKLRKLNNAYTHWQAENVLPHPQDYNPIAVAKDKIQFEYPEQKKVPRLTLEEVREVVSEVTHIRDRTLIVLQLKLGLRATEVCNIKLSELEITNAEVQSHYDQLGEHPVLEPYADAVYIPHNRSGNKSRRPRVLPLDDELRRLLVAYLLIRPDVDAPWVFLTRTQHGQLQKQDINRAWKAAFHPEYAETEWYRPVTSHYGRHYFTTYWRKEQEIATELVEYMRGDVVGSTSGDSRKAINEYVHTYYEDIEDLYRKYIYKLQV